MKKIYLIRHGETEWALNGRHTGTTDIPLTPNGEIQAEKIGKVLHGHSFEAVFYSPLQRAAKTCELAGMQKEARTEPNLVEWNYGDYEGLTTTQIQKNDPHWDIFQNGAPHGESPADICARADSVLSKIAPLRGDVALFSHGHFLRALATRWIKLPLQEGQHFALFPGSISILGFEKDAPVWILWNSLPYLRH